MQVVLVDLDKLSVPEQVRVSELHTPKQVHLLSHVCEPLQVRLMANTGVLVGVHGPGLVNSLFLPRGYSSAPSPPRTWRCWLTRFRWEGR
jgi:hypothetical protein